MKRTIPTILAVSSLLTGCVNDSQVASWNISHEAHNFRVSRRIYFYNGINGEYLLSIEGLCALHHDQTDNQLEVTCKTGENTYKKHFLGLSDNVTYFAEQTEPATVNKYFYRVSFKPSIVVPYVEKR